MSVSLAIVGATGLVGQTMLRVLEERSFPFTSLRLLASARSAGTIIKAFGQDFIVEELTPDSFDSIDIALFSAGGAISKIFAPIAASKGCVVVDNSSAWRLHDQIPLVVPEVNIDTLQYHHGIIANPNCSTIQMVVALKPLHDMFGLKRIVVSTYQSVSGAGQKGINHLMAEIQGTTPYERISSHPLAYNTVFHSISNESGFSEEEVKMKHETRRILGITDLPLAVTCVRVPILGGHGESIAIETFEEVSVESIRQTLLNKPGITLIDEPLQTLYPTVQLAAGNDAVFVGRIRLDDSVKNGALLWVTSDNLRKGAATNAIQIAESLIDHNWLSFEHKEFF